MPALSHRPTSAIEPLESRIAPALLINGANLLVAGSANASGETSVGDHSVEVIKVTSGQAIVWFKDGAILGVSIGANTGLDITGNIFGDIVANLMPTGRLSDSDGDPSNGEDGAVLLANNLVGLKTSPLGGQAGSVGNIITGGSVSHLNISGEISGIYAGDGAYRSDSHVLEGGIVHSVMRGIDTNPIEAGIEGGFELPLSYAQPDLEHGIKGLQAGASISFVQITTAQELQVFAGSGNPNGLTFKGQAPAGGSIHDLTISAAFSTDAPSYYLHAGDGGSGGKGGAGGFIDHIIENTSSRAVTITAGNGGAGTTGIGGAGGGISNLDVQGNSTQYDVHAGSGGNGVGGGAGGSLRNNNFANRAPLGGVIVSADFTGDGVDDILVADEGTGEMVLNKNLGNNAGFERVTQNPEGGLEANIIKTKGNTPSDAAATDFNGDGKLDLVVTYKNSNSVAVFLNQGGGVFWDASLEGDDKFAGFSVDLGLSPTRLALSDDHGGKIAVAGTLDDRGAVQLLSKSSGPDGATLKLEPGVNKFQQLVSDLVSSNDGTFVALGDGSVQSLTVSGIEKQPFIVNPTGVKIAGGIVDLDIDSAGHRLLALGSSGKLVDVFDIVGSGSTGSLTRIFEINLQSSAGIPLSAKFVDDNVADTEDRVAVLSSLPAGAHIDLYTPLPSDNDPATPDVPGYSFDRTLQTTEQLKTFVPSYNNPPDASNLQARPAGFAGLSSSLSEFTFGDSFLTVADYSLPFAAKTVNASAGNGGNAFDLGTKLGKGGAGGSITGLNADAVDITLIAGSGGNSDHGPAGAGGGVSNAGTFKSASGISISPALLADNHVVVGGGNGGSPASAGDKRASGGAGGSISNLSLTVAQGVGIDLLGGMGGTGHGGAGGAGGSISGIKNTTHSGDLSVLAGDGGAALVGAASTSGVGGAGGSINNFSHELQLDDEGERNERSFSISLHTGIGGDSAAAAGGAGGSFNGLQLKLDGANRSYNDDSVKPPLTDAFIDSTLYVDIAAGKGGNGSKSGGFGGSVKGLQYDSVFDQRIRDVGVAINFAVMNLQAGAGGNASAGSGGDGGSILLSKPISGITGYDRDAPTPANNPERVPLIVTAGTGGDGFFKGGAGGSVSGLVAQNAPFGDSADVAISTTHLLGAIVQGGNGGNGGSGDGGRGGSISNALIGVQSDDSSGGQLEVRAGDGGNGGLAPGSSALAKGGAGGSVKSSVFGVVSTAVNLGLLVTGGEGGSGILAGGAGGAVTGLSVNTSQSTEVPSALLIGGAGGSANSVTGFGGKGGDVSSITQGKDVNSSINLIQAGNGGDNLLGKGGTGGNVSAIRTVGFIGRPTADGTPLGVFDRLTVDEGGIDQLPDLFHENGDGTVTFAQGLFVGRGGASGGGQPAAANGSVTNVVARQIAAIAAAMDPDTELFAAVTKIAQVRADLIGFDADRATPGPLNGHFTDSLGGTQKPTTVIPQDGFLLTTTAPLTTAQGVQVKIAGRGDFFIVA